MISKIPILIQYKLAECEIWNPNLTDDYEFNKNSVHEITRHKEHYDILDFGETLGFKDPQFMSFDNGILYGGAYESTAIHHKDYIDVDPDDEDCILPDKRWRGTLIENDSDNDEEENHLNKILDRLRPKQEFDKTIHIDGMTWFNHRNFYKSLHRLNKYPDFCIWKDKNEEWDNKQK